MTESVLIGGEPEDVYLRGGEIIISGCCSLCLDEAVPLAIALLKAAGTGWELTMFDKSLCCASDKLQANMDGFDAGHLTALKSVKYMVRALSKEDALEVIDELIHTAELRKAENE